MGMRIVIRADASHRIGSGHVMRCATLGNQLRKHGAHVSFISRLLPGHYCRWLESNGFTVATLPEVTLPSCDDISANGVSLAAEISESQHILKSIQNVDWLIVDHYDFDARWESAMRPLVKKILAIDDLADRSHDVDVLLDQNLKADLNPYAGRVSPSCTQLLGPTFSLLRPEFRAARQSGRKRDGRISRVIVFMGGSDPKGYTSKVLDAWISAAINEISLDVVVGDASPHVRALESRCAQIPNARVHVQVPDMADLMNHADLMVGGAGSTTWERCCLGLPSVLVSIADNQRSIGSLVAKAGAALYLGDIESVTQTDIAHAITSLIGDPERTRSMSVAASGLVDGLGVNRVAASIYKRLRLGIVSDASSWINPYLQAFLIELRELGHSVNLVHDPADLADGDCAFFLSCSRLVGDKILQRNVHNLVVHESALPEGRGWSPLTWQIIEGKNTIPITLFEAMEKVDSGPIYIQDAMHFSGAELVAELRAVQGGKTIGLCREFIASYPEIIAKRTSQAAGGSYYRRRLPIDSQLDPDSTIRNQFNLLRVVDNDRYPAFFEIGGIRYFLKINREGS